MNIENGILLSTITEKEIFIDFGSLTIPLHMLDILYFRKKEYWNTYLKLHLHYISLKVPMWYSG